MARNIKSVAVIGAGPAGAIATDALVKEQAFDTIRVFERNDVIGGAWVYTPHLPAQIPSLQDVLDNNADSPVQVPAHLPAETAKSELVNSHQIRYSDTPQHENLHSNIIPEVMSYTQYPFPNVTTARLRNAYGPNGPYRHREVIRDWVERIFTHNRFENLLQLSTTVELAEKIGSKWVLTLRKEERGRNRWYQEEFDALVVASGHYHIPWIPSTPGLVEYDARFPGRILHSKHFRDPTKFKNKKVVVVGASVSSSEIIHEILPYAQHPVIGSVRGDPLPAFGWVPWEHPHIVVKKAITKFDPNTGRLTFADESYVDDVDFVIYGTGYTFSFPFLPKLQEEIKQGNRRLPGVYQHTWRIEDPSLAFVGMLGGGFTFRAFEWQAVAVARHLAGRARALPSTEEQYEWERKRVELLKGGKAYYSIAPDYEAFFELLRDIAGDPVPGTTGLTLPVFDKRLLELWPEMVKPKLAAWKRSRQAAEDALKPPPKARL